MKQADTRVTGVTGANIEANLETSIIMADSNSKEPKQTDETWGPDKQDGRKDLEKSATDAVSMAILIINAGQ